MKKIAVIGVQGGWSSERLADAVAQRTGFRLLLDAERLRWDSACGSLALGGSPLPLLDGIIIKKTGSTYSPNHADRLRVLDWACSRGLSMFSKPSCILRAYDRLTCTLSLRAGGIPMPPTVVTSDVHEAVSVIEQFGSAVLKPLYSTKGRGMVLVRAGAEAADQVLRFREAGNPIIYLQKLIPLPGRDLGVTFLGGQYLATYARIGGGHEWSTTTLSGGRYAPCEPSSEVLELARRAQALFGLDFTCVDVAETLEGPVVFEVSAFGGFRGLLQAHRLDAAERFVDYVLDCLNHA